MHMIWLAYKNNKSNGKGKFYYLNKDEHDGGSEIHSLLKV